MSKPPTRIPGLRSPYDEVGGIVLFGRMLDKIRLHAAGKLPEDWVVAMGMDKGFDGWTCRFLGISYEEVRAATERGGTDEELLALAFSKGRQPSAEEIEVWNGYMTKRGWRDIYAERLAFRLDEAGLPADAAETMFDFIDLDEGRPPRGGN